MWLDKKESISTHSNNKAINNKMDWMICIFGSLFSRTIIRTVGNCSVSKWKRPREGERERESGSKCIIFRCKCLRQGIRRANEDIDAIGKNIHRVHIYYPTKVQQWEILRIYNSFHFNSAFVGLDESCSLGRSPLPPPSPPPSQSHSYY